MKTIAIATLLAACAAVPAASAETFTFTSTSTTQNALVAPVPGGKPVQAAFLSGASHAVYASGRAVDNKFQCADWSSPPGSIFDAYGACNYVEPGGDTATILIGCDFATPDRLEANCWGGLEGIDGPHKGKSGTISWHAKTSADGKSGTSSGVGQWND